MAEFHSLKVKAVEKEAANTVVISLEVPSSLESAFAYTHGQYLTFRKVINNEELRRSYSLCSSPLEPGEWKVAVKKVEGGKFSMFANDELKAGDMMEVMAPMGNFFTPLSATQKKNYVAFAAGSGITPIMSIVKTTLATEPESTFTLYYGNRNMASVIFLKELESLRQKYSGRFTLHLVMSGETGTGKYTGRITPENCEVFAADNANLFQADTYFLCGPEKLIFDVQDKLESKGVDPKKIKFELFNTPVATAENADEMEEGEEINSEVKVIMDGEETSFTLSSAGPAILDAALDAGADAPFSCKGAVCCTCRAKLVEGKVYMEMNYALTDQEVEEGYILTCQSHPRTARVVVDYDAD